MWLVRKIGEDRMNAVFPRTHILAQKQYVTRRDLKDENLILACTPDSEIGEEKRIIEKFWKCGYHPNVVAKIEDVETILLMLSANMGVSILTGIYDDSDADQRAAGSSSFWWTGGYD